MCERYVNEDECNYYPTDCYHCEHNPNNIGSLDEDEWPEERWLCNWETARLIRYCNQGLFTNGLLKDALVELFYRGIAPTLINDEVWKYVSDIYEDALQNR